MKKNRHFIFIESFADIVGPQVMLWGEAQWWPEDCKMKFVRKTPGELNEGTQFQQEVLLPMGPKWDVKITKLVPNKEIERTFLNGMFKGKESVIIEERVNGTRVEYVMEYQIQGIINKILWKLVFERLHNKNIDMILAALQKYAMEKHNSRSEE